MQTQIQTRKDLDALDDKSKREFLELLKGSVTVKVDVAVYPSDYDSALKEGESGYIAPVWNDVVEINAIKRLGFKSVSDLDECISSYSK